MVDQKLTVKVTADTEGAVEAIEDVTRAIEELEAALDSLQEQDIGIELTGTTTTDWVSTTDAMD